MHSILGWALLLVGVMDAVTGMVLSQRMPADGRRRVMRIAFAVSASTLIAMGLGFLLQPMR